MFRTSLSSLLLTLALAASAAGQNAFIPTATKLLIQSGRDTPYAPEFREHYRKFNSLPFDGAAVRIRTGLPGATKDELVHDGFTWTFQNDKPWNEAMFADSVAALSAVAADADRRLRHNFLEVKALPGSVDYFDDAGWAELTNRFRLAARIVRQAGLEGILLDVEPLRSLPHRQFSYFAQPQRQRFSPAEYREQVCRRGREMMTAIVTEQPSLVILCRHFLNGLMKAYDPNGRPTARLGDDYDLLPALVDGWLDVAPPTVWLVDGNEDAYLYADREDYRRAAREIGRDDTFLVSPENRDKYRAQVQTSHGFYLDGYLGAPGSFYFKPMGPGGPAALLHEHVSEAIAVSSRYVWIHGEKANWWPGGLTAKQPPWEAEFPGIVEALTLNDAERQRHDAVDLSGTPMFDIAGLIQAFQFGPNLVRNGDVSGGSTGWTAWQEKKDGAAAFDAAQGRTQLGSLRMVGTHRGAWIQDVPVVGGRSYAVQAWCASQGLAAPSIEIAWKDAAGKVVARHRRLVLVPEDTAGWRFARGTITIPREAAKLNLQLTMHSDAAPGDAVWFDDVRVTPLE